MSDVLDKIDETLTYWSAGLGEEITVEKERPSGSEWFTDFLDQVFAGWGERTVHPLATLAAPLSCASITRAMIELERNAAHTALLIHADLEPGFRALRLALAKPLRPKVARRLRRAQLRRVHRDYVQRKRRRSHLGYGVVTVSMPIYDECRISPTPDTEAS
jgi:hypothetical protein